MPYKYPPTPAREKGGKGEEKRKQKRKGKEPKRGEERREHTKKEGKENRENIPRGIVRSKGKGTVRVKEEMTLTPEAFGF